VNVDAPNCPPQLMENNLLFLGSNKLETPFEWEIMWRVLSYYCGERPPLFNSFLMLFYILGEYAGLKTKTNAGAYKYSRLQSIPSAVRGAHEKVQRINYLIRTHGDITFLSLRAAGQVHYVEASQ